MRAGEGGAGLLCNKLFQVSISPWKTLQFTEVYYNYIENLWIHIIFSD